MHLGLSEFNIGDKVQLVSYSDDQALSDYKESYEINTGMVFEVKGVDGVKVIEYGRHGATLIPGRAFFVKVS